METSDHIVYTLGKDTVTRRYLKVYLVQACPSGFIIDHLTFKHWENKAVHLAVGDLSSTERASWVSLAEMMLEMSSDLVTLAAA
ncbi:hypothetical protein NDU88_001156 [Pleurodeles waltl]|uniref:Uncharacterized protein n=1 Tax=Pleurodeles waltl TaxID=8319 RepID=A0AAV7LXV9_PLEWA|nr:hypothetical protein NDU88_001156 [Pleurodeles waltl]